MEQPNSGGSCPCDSRASSEYFEPDPYGAYTADLYEGEPTREEAWLESDIRDAEQDYADRQASAATESTGNDYMSQEYHIHLAEDYSLPPQSEQALDPRLVEARTQYGLVCWSQRGNS
jgi:hypothetical protein